MRSSFSERKVGLALGSGAAKGLAHIGVLAALQEQGIHIDMIAGTSMGALVGALYAMGKDIDQIRSLAIDLGQKRFSFLADLTLPKSGFIRGRKIKNMLRLIIGDVEFRDLEIPFACSATDIESGQEVVIKQGLVREGVKTSCSIPVILTPTRLGGRYLVDGGLLDPVPVRILKDMGADFIIAVNVIPAEQQKPSEASQDNKEPKDPNILSIAMQTVNIISGQGLKTSLIGADVIIEPQVAHIGWGDFHRADECIYQGELAVQISIQEIRQLTADFSLHQVSRV